MEDRKNLNEQELGKVSGGAGEGICINGGIVTANGGTTDSINEKGLDIEFDPRPTEFNKD